MDNEKSIGHRAWDMEQLFQDAGVFRNGMNDRPSHMDSYMTVIDFVLFDKTLSETKDNFTKEEWLDACEYWIGVNHHQQSRRLAIHLSYEQK